jgi:hypothetical protein
MSRLPQSSRTKSGRSTRRFPPLARAVSSLMLLSASAGGVMAGGQVGLKVAVKLPGGDDTRRLFAGRVQDFAVRGAEIGQQHQTGLPLPRLDAGEFEKGLDFGAGGTEAVTSQSTAMARGCLAARCLARADLAQKDWEKKDGGDVGIKQTFQGKIGGSLVFHAAGPAEDMGGVGEQGKQGEIPGRHSPEAAGPAAGGNRRVGCGRLHPLVIRLNFSSSGKRLVQSGCAEGKGVLIAGADHRHGQHVGQNFGDMQGAVAFARTDVDVDLSRAGAGS